MNLLTRFLLISKCCATAAIGMAAVPEITVIKDVFYLGENRTETLDPYLRHRF